LRVGKDPSLGSRNGLALGTSRTKLTVELKIGLCPHIYQGWVNKRSYMALGVDGSWN